MDTDWSSGRSPLAVVVIGSHLGSNMEPLWMVRDYAGAAGIKATVYGTIYPFPDLACQLFGHCERSLDIEEVTTMLRTQMYNPTWRPAELLEPLQRALDME